MTSGAPIRNGKGEIGWSTAVGIIHSAGAEFDFTRHTDGRRSLLGDKLHCCGWLVLLALCTRHHLI